MGNCLFEGRACLTLWPSRWVLIREGGGLVLFITWALICQTFSRAWSMNIDSQVTSEPSRVSFGKKFVRTLVLLN